MGSLREADFQGLRPVSRLRRMMPSDQTSLNNGEYVPLGAKGPPWHSKIGLEMGLWKVQNRTNLGSCGRRCLS